MGEGVTTRAATFWRRIPPRARTLTAISATIFAILLAAIVFRIQTNKGTIIVEIADAAVEAKLKENGLEILDTQNNRAWTIQAADTKRLPPGQFKARLATGSGLKLLVTDGSGAEFETSKFTLKRGGNVRVRVTLEAPATVTKATVKRPPSTTNYALDFDGKAGVVLLPSLELNDAEPITVEATIALHSFAAEQSDDHAVIFATHGGYGYRLRLAENRKLMWIVDRRTSTSKGYHAKTVFMSIQERPSPGQKLHVAGVCDGNQVRFYINGQLQQPAKPSPKPDQVVWKDCSIGGQGAKKSQRNCFEGIIDEVRISNIARYTEDFTPQKRFEPDEHTLALYHFDEGSGEVAHDASGNASRPSFSSALLMPRPATPTAARPNGRWGSERESSAGSARKMRRSVRSKICRNNPSKSPRSICSTTSRSMMPRSII